MSILLYTASWVYGPWSVMSIFLCKIQNCCLPCSAVMQFLHWHSDSNDDSLAANATVLFSQLQTPAGNWQPYRAEDLLSAELGTRKCVASRQRQRDNVSELLCYAKNKKLQPLGIKISCHNVKLWSQCLRQWSWVPSSGYWDSSIRITNTDYRQKKVYGDSVTAERHM